MSSPLLSPRYASQSRMKHTKKFKRRKHQDPCIESTSYQPGKHRRHAYGRKQPETWRTDLTALSHCHNLYVIVHQDELHLFEPQHSTHAISKDAAALVPLPISDSRLHGYINPQRPHSVNNVIIGQLGDREALLCSCDDGDVLAYYTDSLVRAVHISNHDRASRGRAVDEVRPFFHVNVKMSAWGLSIHSEARMIAVSSNTHRITVFAFALSHVVDDQTERRIEEDAAFAQDVRPRSVEEMWVSDTVFAAKGWRVFDGQSPESQLRHLQERMKDTCIVLGGHDDNIPTVSFCNTGDDPEGRFLVSADIRGTYIIWDLWSSSPVRAFVPKPEGEAILPMSHSGWGTHWLDTRSFRTSTPNEAFRSGSEFYAELAGGAERSAILVAGSHGALDTHPWDPLHSENGDSLSYEEERLVNNYINSDREDSFSDQASIPIAEEVPRSRSVSPSPPRSLRNRLSEPFNTPPHRSRKVKSTLHNNLQNSSGSPLRAWEDHWPNTEKGEETVWIQEGDTDPVHTMPRTPLLLIRRQSICLFQSACINEIHRAHPFTILTDPLDQETPVEWQDHFSHIDRMNMSTYIPELGIVLAGSPKGRVAVLSLHAVRNSHLSDEAWKPLYTMRLDAILPTSKQERRGQRPAFPLLGVAAGPIPGQLNSQVREKTVASRTWRVILLYRDEAILTYELWRKGGDDDALGVRGIEDVYVG